jgi:hypothetical protein
MAESALSEKALSVCSSVNDAAWHDLSGDGAYECWHFDAVSDDGREALVVNFYDNYVLSPRYHDRVKLGVRSLNDGSTMTRVPAVSFTYAVEGKAVCRAVNEFRAGEFKADTDRIGVKIGGSEFHSDTVEYGTGYLLKLNLRTVRGRHINAELEWLFVESNLMPPKEYDADLVWNIVAPRSDVSGRISLIGSRGETRKLVHFRGTGYHDHLRCTTSRSDSRGTRVWGRAHFIDTTAIFSQTEQGEEKTLKLFLVRDGEMSEMDMSVENKDVRRGFRNRLSFMADGLELKIDAQRKISSDPSESTMLSNVMLNFSDKDSRHAKGLTGLIEPSPPSNGLSRWIADLPIGREGRSPLF